MKILKEIMKKPTKWNRQLQEAEKHKKRWNILRGDRVEVVAKRHSEYGKQGFVLEVDRTRDRVFVEGLNIGVSHLQGDPERGTKGKRVMRERGIHYSSVNLVDPVTNLPTRISRKYLEDGTKVRVAKRSGAIIPRPEILAERRKPMRTNITDKDTTDDEDVWEVTYVPYAERNVQESKGFFES